MMIKRIHWVVSFLAILRRHHQKSSWWTMRKKLWRKLKEKKNGQINKRKFKLKDVSMPVDIKSKVVIKMEVSSSGIVGPWEDINN